MSEKNEGITYYFAEGVTLYIEETDGYFLGARFGRWETLKQFKVFFGCFVK